MRKSILFCACVCISMSVYSQDVEIVLTNGQKAIVSHIEDTMLPRGAVLMLHGFQGQLNEVADVFKDLADTLRQRGIVSLRFNYRFEGERVGYHITSTIETRLDDTMRAYKELKKRYPTVKIGVLGFSLGGLTATFFVSRDDVDVTSTVLWSSVYDGGYSLISPDPLFNEKLREMYSSEYEKNYFEHTDWTTHKISKKFINGMIGYKALDVIGNYDGALLTVRAGDDYLPHTDKDILNRVPTRIKKHLRMKGDHVFYVFDEKKSQAKPLIRKTSDWFYKTLTTTE